MHLGIYAWSVFIKYIEYESYSVPFDIYGTAKQETLQSWHKHNH